MDGIFVIGMLGLGYLKVSGLSLVPVPPHIIHAFILPKCYSMNILLPINYLLRKIIDDDS